MHYREERDCATEGPMVSGRVERIVDLLFIVTGYGVGLRERMVVLGRAPCAR